MHNTNITLQSGMLDCLPSTPTKQKTEEGSKSFLFKRYT